MLGKALLFSAVIPCLTKAFNGFHHEPGAGEDMLLPGVHSHVPSKEVYIKAIHRRSGISLNAERISVKER